MLRGQGIGFSSIKTGDTFFSLFLSLVTPDIHFDDCPPGGKTIWGLGKLALVTQIAYTLRCVPEVLTWLPSPGISKHWFPVFLGVLLSAPAWGTWGITSFELLPRDQRPCPRSDWLCGATRAPPPGPPRGCASGLLWFRFSFSAASADRALAWLPASWQEQHVKCRPGRGMEWRGTGFLSASPSES